MPNSSSCNARSRSLWMLGRRRAPRRQWRASVRRGTESRPLPVAGRRFSGSSPTASWSRLVMVGEGTTHAARPVRFRDRCARPVRHPTNEMVLRSTGVARGESATRTRESYGALLASTYVRLFADLSVLYGPPTIHLFRPLLHASVATLEPATSRRDGSRRPAIGHRGCAAGGASESHLVRTVTR